MWAALKGFWAVGIAILEREWPGFPNSGGDMRELTHIAAWVVTSVMVAEFWATCYTD